MRAQVLLVLGLLAASAPTEWATAKKPQPQKKAQPQSRSGACALQCPQGHVVVHYTWEIHPERMIYDDDGKPQIPPEAPWLVSCVLRCEQRAINQPTKEWKADKVVCSSGGEPKPYTGPWRITGQFTRECSATARDGCGLKCHPIRAPKPAGKEARGKPAKK